MSQQISWNELEKLVAQATSQIKASAWQPDVIIALSRGGFVPATMIAYQLGVKTLGGLPVDKNNDGVRSLSPLMELGDYTDKKVLIVDDGILGGTLRNLSTEAVRSHGGESRMCALISIGQCPDPDYLVKTLPKMPHFPWE